MALPDYDRKAILERFIREVWSDGRLDAVDAYLGRSYTIYHDPGDPWEGRTLTLDEYKERARVSRARLFQTSDSSFNISLLMATPSWQRGCGRVHTWAIYRVSRLPAGVSRPQVRPSITSRASGSSATGRSWTG